MHSSAQKLPQRMGPAERIAPDCEKSTTMMAMAQKMPATMAGSNEASRSL
jgi:hypothetical protein